MNTKIVPQESSMAMGYRCFTQELRIQIPTLKRVPESASELFLECVFVRPSWRKLKVRIDIWVASPNQGGREQMPVFGQAPVLGGSGPEVLSNTQTTGAPHAIRSFQYGGPAFLVVEHPKPIRVRCSRLGETDGWLSSVVR